MNTREIAEVILNGKSTIETKFGKMGLEAMVSMLNMNKEESTWQINYYPEEIDENEYEKFRRESGLRYRTYHIVKNGKEIGRVTAARMLHPDNPELRQIAFAYTSPKDKFDKFKGQAISLGRILKGNKAIICHKSDDMREILVANAERVGIKWMKGVDKEDVK